MKTMVGIYKITSPSGRVYIGQSWEIHKRWTAYKYKKPYSRQFGINNSLIKYGFDNHLFEIVHELPNDIEQIVLDAYEQLYMDAYRSCGVKLLNCKEAGSSGKLSEETKDRLRGKRRGFKFSDETKKKMSLSQIGKVVSEETKRKIGEANKGRPCPEHVKKLFKMFCGRVNSETHNRNISAGLSGVKKSNEHKLNLSKSRIENQIALGSNNPKAKLNDSDVIEIRRRYNEGERQVDLSGFYNVGRNTICDIVNNRKWKHLN